jgi:hypothetical protein
VSNNTVACTIRKNRVIYTAELDFTFGVAGTMGSEKTIVIDFVDNQTAIIAGRSDISYALEVRMYDEANKPIDLSEVPIEWTWYTPGFQQDQMSSHIDLQALHFEGQKQINEDNTITWLASVTKSDSSVINLELSNTNTLSLSNPKHIYIAKAIVGEEGAKLETYFPIPIKASEEYSHIEGAT